MRAITRAASGAALLLSMAACGLVARSDGLASDLTPEERAWVEQVVAESAEHTAAPSEELTAYWASEPETRAAAVEAWTALLRAIPPEERAESFPTCAPWTWREELTEGRMSYDRFNVLVLISAEREDLLPEKGAELCPVDERGSLIHLGFIDAASPKVKIAYIDRVGFLGGDLPPFMQTDPAFYQGWPERLTELERPGTD